MRSSLYLAQHVDLEPLLGEAGQRCPWIALQWDSSPFPPLRCTPLFEERARMLMRSRRNQLEGGQEQHCEAQSPVTDGPTRRQTRESGRCLWRHLVHGRKIVEKLLMDEMLGFCCGLASLGHAAERPHLWLMGSRCSTLQGEGIQKQGTEDSDALSLLFPLTHQSRRENYT